MRHEIQYGVIMISVIAFAIFITPLLSFAQTPTSSQGITNHPLTPVTSPMYVGNGTVLQLVMIFNTKPVEDMGLADYNKAVNFEKAKSMILNATFSDKMLQSIINDVENQRSALQTEGKNITRYNHDGSTTLQYSDWWMKSYVTSRLDEDGLQVVLSNMQQKASLQDAIGPVDREMNKLIVSYDLDVVPSQPQQNTTSSMISNATQTLSIPTKDQTGINKTQNNNTITITNMSKSVVSVPEFPVSMVPFIIALIFIVIFTRTLVL